MFLFVVQHQRTVVSNDQAACRSACFHVQINQVYRSNITYIETVLWKYLVLLKMMFHILVFDIPGAGHPTEFTISYTGDKNVLSETAKRAFGTYKYVGMIKDGSPVYHYHFNDNDADTKLWIARQYLGAENDKIWKGKVMIMVFFAFSRVAYIYAACIYTSWSTYDSYISDGLSRNFGL